MVTPQTLTRLDYAALALYFAANVGLGWLCSRRRQTSHEYFLGQGRVPWWAAGISFFATGVSSISFMALPAKSYSEDWITFGAGPAQALATLAIGLWFAPKLRRLNLVTVFDYLERRFDRRVRLLGAGLALLLKIFGRISVILLLPALALSTVTGLNVYLSLGLMGLVTCLYAVKGGFTAVLWTDVLQSAVMVGAVTLALTRLGGATPGGIGGIISQGQAEHRFHMVDWAPNIARPTVWAFVGLMLASLFTQIADQPSMQRVFATANERDARRSVLLAGVLGLVIVVVFYFVGTALHVFYETRSARLEPGLANDAIFPYFIVNELPHGFVGLIIAGVFAAAMGAVSSALNATAAIVVTDFAPAGLDERRRLRWAQLTTLGAGLLGTGMAAYLARLGVPSLWEQFLKLIALIGGGFPGVFALGLLTRRATANGVIIGAVASIAVTAWVQFFTSTTVFLHGFVAVASCVVIGYAASLVDRYS